MKFLQAIRIIFATTPNFLNGFMMHLSSKSRKIKFKGSPPIEMTPYEYYTLKLAVFHGYSINKDGDQWELSKGNMHFRMTTDTFSYALLDDDILSHYQSIDFKGKTVLDVGGYIGDTAVLFHHLGAEKIIIYEPVKAHIPLIMKNIELNHINAEVKNLGVGRAKGLSTVHYHDLNLRFGRDTDDLTLKKMTIMLEDIKNVILESHADIAKFNCESCEEAILSLDQETIQKISIYVVEMHEEDLERQLLEKFKGAGFEHVRANKPRGLSPLYTLKRV